MVDGFDDNLAQSSAMKSFKVICVGDSSVGKTSLIQRYTMDIYNEHGQQPTIAQDFRHKFEPINPQGSVSNSNLKGSIAQEQVKLIIWDTAG